MIVDAYVPADAVALLASGKGESAGVRTVEAWLDPFKTAHWLSNRHITDPWVSGCKPERSVGDAKRNLTPALCYTKHISFVFEGLVIVETVKILVRARGL